MKIKENRIKEIIYQIESEKSILSIGCAGDFLDRIY